MRNKFSETVFKNIKKNKNIYVVAADISPSGTMAKLQKSQKNFINVGVAEQNMIGVCAGLAMSGKKVFAYRNKKMSFGILLTTLPLDKTSF